MESIRKDSITNNPLPMNINYSKFLERDFNATFNETDRNGRVVNEYITKENAEIVYITLNQVRKEIGSYAFNKLNEITSYEQKEGLHAEKQRSLGAFYTTINSETRAIKGKMGLNDDYYGPSANNEVRALVKEKYRYTLKNTVQHESGHYLLWRYNLKNDPEIFSFFNEHRTYILEHFRFIRSAAYTEEQRPEEFFVEAFSWLLSGRLGEMGPDKKLNDKIQSFIKKKVELFKELEKHNE